MGTFYLIRDLRIDRWSLRLYLPQNIILFKGEAKMGKAAKLLPGICLGLGFSNFILFGLHQYGGNTDWANFYIGTFLMSVYVCYLTIQSFRVPGN